MASAAIEVRPLTAAIGAEIHGVDLREPLDDADVAAIRAGVPRAPRRSSSATSTSTDEQHLAFALRFGPLHVSPLATSHQESPEVIVLDQVSPKGEGADEWHSDNTFLANPPMGSILRAVQLPAVGGDTCFANMYAAYDGLSAADARAGRRAARRPRHHQADAEGDRGRARHVRPRDDAGTVPAGRAPVVVTHPETGRKALFVNRNSTTQLVGFSERENDVLLPFLFDHVRSPEYQCRFHWEEGSMAFWDNRCVQHYAVADYTERRVMHRVTVAGPPAR